MAAAQSASIKDQFLRIAKTPQFYWWVGHLFTLGFTFLSLVTFLNVTLFYKLAFVGALMSYGIVIRSSHQSFNLSMDCAAKVFSDENFAYAFLAIYWLINSPIFVSLIPFAMYSIFHYLGYLRTTILPILSPGIKQELESKTQTPSPATKVYFTIGQLSELYAAKTIQAASFLEVSLVPLYLIFRVVTFSQSIFSLFFYGQFLRQRASQSPQTRASFSQLAMILDGYLLKPSIPAPVQNAYRTVKTYLASLVIQIPPAASRAN